MKLWATTLNDNTWLKVLISIGLLAYQPVSLANVSAYYSVLEPSDTEVSQQFQVLSIEALQPQASRYASENNAYTIIDPSNLASLNAKPSTENPPIESAKAFPREPVFQISQPAIIEPKEYETPEVESSHQALTESEKVIIEALETAQVEPASNLTQNEKWLQIEPQLKSVIAKERELEELLEYFRSLKRIR